MKKDIDFRLVEDIGIAIVLESDEPNQRNWKVYLLNFKSETITDILVSSKGYGTLQNEQVQTSLFRHSLGSLLPNEFKAIELIDESLFAITNEFWLSFYINNTIFDKKFIFLPETVIESNLIQIPIIHKLGVLIR